MNTETPYIPPDHFADVDPAHAHAPSREAFFNALPTVGMIFAVMFCLVLAIAGLVSLFYPLIMVALGLMIVVVGAWFYCRHAN